MTIHREGYATLGLTVAVLFTLNMASLYFFPQNAVVTWGVLAFSVVFFLIILQFFRSPSVRIEKNERHVLAPADGKVVVIEEVIEGEYLRRNCRQVSIFMSPINVHVNRNPISGVVEFFRYHPGAYLVAWHPKASTENERTTVVLRNQQGVQVLMRQIAGALARRICWYVNEGQQVEQGQEFGFIKFGSRVDLFLPLDAKITVEIGQVTSAGKTIIAELP